MRRRYHLSYHSTFEQANAARIEAKLKNPDAEYQVRKRTKNFALVERLGSNDAAAIQAIRSSRPRKKHKHRSRPSI